MKTYETSARKYEFEILIEAEAPRVWEALTTNIAAWWLPDFHMVGPGSVVKLDAQVGGHLSEKRPGGGGLLWYTVVMVEPGASLNLVGHIAPAWGGPAVTMLGLTLVGEGSTTRLKVEDALLGHVSKDMAASLETGWKQLFGDGLKAHVES